MGDGENRGQAAPAVSDVAEVGDERLAAAADAAVRVQLEAIRDEWLRPLVERSDEVARQLGRVETERDALRAELARLRAEREPPRRDAAARVTTVRLTSPTGPAAGGVHSLGEGAPCDRNRQCRGGLHCVNDRCRPGRTGPSGRRSWWRSLLRGR